MDSVTQWTAWDIEEDVTGQEALTESEYGAISRAVQKGYASSHEAYRLGVVHGIRAALEPRPKLRHG
jgi:hypothetical protein